MLPHKWTVQYERELGRQNLLDSIINEQPVDTDLCVVLFWTLHRAVHKHAPCCCFKFTMENRRQ